MTINMLLAIILYKLLLKHLQPSRLVIHACPSHMFLLFIYDIHLEGLPPWPTCFLPPPYIFSLSYFIFSLSLIYFHDLRSATMADFPHTILLKVFLTISGNSYFFYLFLLLDTCESAMVANSDITLSCTNTFIFPVQIFAPFKFHILYLFSKVSHHGSLVIHFHFICTFISFLYLLL